MIYTTFEQIEYGFVLFNNFKKHSDINRFRKIKIFLISHLTRKSRLTKIGRKTGIWKIGKKPISENTKNFEIKIFLWIEESITNNYRYIRSSYLEIDPILSEPVGMIISFITDGIHYYIKFWSQNFLPLPTFHRTYTKSSSILLITP